MKKTFVFSLLLLFTLSSMAGTLFFKNGSIVSKVKLISIANGVVTIEKDKARVFYKLKTVKAYYSTNVTSVGNNDPREFSKYKVVVSNIKAPKKGVDHKNKTSVFTFAYDVNKKSKSLKKIRAPYFYLYVLTTESDEYGHRRVYRYYVPKIAKPKGKGYDEAAIMAKLSDFKRPIWNSDRKDFHGGLSGRKISISLKSVKKRKVLAWRLEVWGDSEMVYQKSEVQYPESRVGKKWWRRIRK
ncbi:MAG: hypothetical protein GXP32_07780 [Kiritimatiellaeota bacterium]|nr:hypothetical protein [Kiritimatiellota bacterium]